MDRQQAGAVPSADGGVSCLWPDEARMDRGRWGAREYMRWYNHEHRHSGSGYVTPAQRHARADLHVLEARHELYRCMSRPGKTTRDVGRVTRATGSALKFSRSIRSVTRLPMPVPCRTAVTRLCLHESGDTYLDARRHLDMSRFLRT